MKININPIFAFLYASFKCSRVCVCVCVWVCANCAFLPIFIALEYCMCVYIFVRCCFCYYFYIYFCSLQPNTENDEKIFISSAFFRLFIDCLTNRGWTHFESRCAIKTVWTYKTCVGYEKKKTMWKKMFLKNLTIFRRIQLNMDRIISDIDRSCFIIMKYRHCHRI